MRKNKTFVTSLFLGGVLSASMLACSKPQPQKSSFSSLQLLPSDALGFMAADIQFPSMKTFMESPRFRNYIQAAKSMGDGDPTLKDGMAAYWAVIETLGIIPKEGEKYDAFSELLSYIRPSSNGGLEGVFAYFSNPANDPRVKLSAAKKLLAEKKYTFTEATVKDYQIVEIPLFSGESNNPATEFYKSTLGLTKVVIAASEKNLLLASSQGAVEHFAEQRSAPPKILDDAFYKKSITELDPSSARPVRIALDIQTLTAKISKGQSEIEQKLPLHTFVGVSDMSESTITFSSKTSVLPKDASQAEVLRALQGSKSGTLPYQVSIDSALAFVIDGKAVTRLLPLASSQIPAEAQSIAKGYLDLISSFAVGISPSSTTSPLPEVAISLSSNNPEELYKKVKELQSLAPLPQGMGLRAGVVEGLSTEFLPTPLGVKVHLWKGKDRVVIAGGDEALLSVAQPPKGHLDSKGVVASTQKAAATSLAGLVVNYEKIASLMASINQTAAMFGQSSAPIPDEQLNSMKALGTIALSLGYEPGVASLVYSMEFPQ
jgi:hypothetical protein